MGKSLEERVAKLEEIIKRLQSPKVTNAIGIGDIFELAGYNWKILDITEIGYMCLADSIGNRPFDEDSNNWTESDLREYLNSKFYEKLAGVVGSENIIETERDLFSLDGQTEYGKCEDKVSLLTVDEYRKYRSLIPNTDEWWWLITSWSTHCNGYNTSQAVVSPRGDIGSSFCNFNVGGVRPFVSFSSAIFESEDK